MALNDVQWMKKLAVRDNILYSPNSYIPVVVEDIPKYISLLDYQDNCVKDVHTIGRIRKVTTSKFYLRSITPNVDMEFPMRLENVTSKQLYAKNKNEPQNPFSVNEKVVRIFGTLRDINGVTTLDVSRLVTLECPMESLSILSLQSRLARRQYKQFYRTPQLDELLRSAWDTMDRRKPRKPK